MPRRRKRPWRGAITLAALALLAFVGWRFYRHDVARHPGNYPWVPLSLDQPVGRFTAAKLAALGSDPARCAALLASAGVPVRPMPSVTASNGRCGYTDGVIAPIPSRPVTTSCPVASALLLWDRLVVQPAAARHFDSRVAAYDHFGSYNCRRMYNRPDAAFSEHATADAIDIAGFRLANGRRIAIVKAWDGPSAAERAFLRDVRDGACDLFSTTLSPDYNAAHRDHLHLDQAMRGRSGWSVCR